MCDTCREAADPSQASSVKCRWCGAVFMFRDATGMRFACASHHDKDVQSDRCKLEVIQQTLRKLMEQVRATPDVSELQHLRIMNQNLTAMLEKSQKNCDELNRIVELWKSRYDKAQERVLELQKTVAEPPEVFLFGQPGWQADCELAIKQRDAAKKELEYLQGQFVEQETRHKKQRAMDNALLNSATNERDEWQAKVYRLRAAAADDLREQARLNNLLADSAMQMQQAQMELERTISGFSTECQLLKGELNDAQQERDAMKQLLQAVASKWDAGLYTDTELYQRIVEASK